MWWFLACTPPAERPDPVVEVTLETGRESSAGSPVDSPLESSPDSVAPCSQVLDGDVRVETDDELAALADVARIDGELSVELDVERIALPCLEELGDVEFERSSVQAIELPALHTAGHVMLNDLPALVELDLSALGQADALTLRLLASLPAVEIGPARVGDLTIYRLDVLERTDGLDVTASGDVYVVSNVGLEHLHVTGASLGSLTVANNVGLLEIGGDRSVEALGGDLLLYGNIRMTSIDGLFGLTAVAGDFRVQDNLVLPTADVEALRAQVDVGGAVTVSGNGG